MFSRKTLSVKLLILRNVFVSAKELKERGYKFFKLLVPHRARRTLKAIKTMKKP